MKLKDTPQVLNSNPKKPSGDYKKFAIQKYPISVFDFYFSTEKKPIINKKTKVTSIGSCFAENIARYLKQNKYNYLKTENGGMFSANWGIVFNSSSIRQIFEYSFDLFEPQISWWERENGRMQDPYRRDIIYQKGTHEEKRSIHYNCSRKAIENTEVIIITLGLVEVWRCKKDKIVFWRVPPSHLFKKHLYEFYVMTVDDVYKDLERIKFIINTYNPSCKLILTVSPIPFQATFREDVDVISANVYSKAVSSVAAMNFFTKYKNNGVYYFPSFEFVRYGFNNPYIKDGRHLKPGVVNTMMKFFECMFCY